MLNKLKKLKPSSELGKNTLIFSVGVFGSKIIKFFLVPLYTVYMSTEEYSVADLLLTTSTLIVPFLSLGISNAVMRFTLGQKNNYGSALKLSLLITSIGSVPLFILIPWLKSVSSFGGYGYFLPFLYLLSCYKSVLAGYCKGIEKNFIYSIDGIISALSLTSLSILLIGVLKTGVLGYILSTIISELISIVFLCINCKTFETLIHGKIRKQLSMEMLRYSIPLMPNELSWWIIQMSDRYMLVYFCGAALNGVYSIAYKIPSIFNLIVSVFYQAFGISAIKLADSEGLGNGRLSAHRFDKIFSIYTTFSFTVVSILILLSKPLAFIIYQKDYFVAWKYVPLLLIAFLIGNLQAYYVLLYAGIKKSNIVFVSTFSGAVTNIILNYFMIQRFQAYGAAIATVVSYLVVYLIISLSIRKYVDMEHSFGKIITSLILIFTSAFLYIQDSVPCFIASAVIALVIILIYGKQNYEIVTGMFRKIFKTKTDM